jgi:DNA-directed RNA polymerase subunit RPC12/RpoP
VLPTHDVPCPRCGKPLYSAISLEDATNAGAVSSPKIEKSAQGYYMHCPHCGERIAMQRMTAGDSKAFQPVR